MDQDQKVLVRRLLSQTEEAPSDCTTVEDTQATQAGSIESGENASISVGEMIELGGKKEIETVPESKKVRNGRVLVFKTRLANTEICR